MKNIVILSAFLSPFRSGAEACAEEVPLLLCDEFAFTIITARMRRDLPKRAMLGGKIPVIRVGVGVPILDKWLYPFLAPLVARRLKPDIVHAILETFAGLALVLCRWTVPSAKRMLTCQTTNRSFLKGFIVRSPDTVTAISTHLLNLCATLGRKDVIRIPNGIHVHAFKEARNAYQKIPARVLFVGRLEPMKGVEGILRAFAQVTFHDARLRIVGDGSQRTTLEALAQSLGISEKVMFTGRISADHIYKEYAEAEIFIGLPLSEAFGNVFIEAQAGGCAVISTMVGGIGDIVSHERTGLLVAPNDLEASSLALERLLADRSLRTSLGSCGHDNAERYDWSIIAGRYAELYAQAIDIPHHPLC